MVSCEVNPIAESNFGSRVRGSRTLPGFLAELPGSL